MTTKDAAELYLAQVSSQSVPDAGTQLAWVARIDRAQRRLNRALADCPAGWPKLREQLLAARASNRLTRIIARSTTSGDPDALDVQVAALIDSLHAPPADPERVDCCLQALRLRSESSAALLAAVTTAGRDDRGDLMWREPLDRARRALAVINRTTDLLVRANQRLVASVARQYHYAPLAFMDLVQEGNLGLLRAIERFDPGRGTRVSTYALWWVRRSMIYAIARQGQSVRPSVAQYWQARHVARSTDQLHRARGRSTSQQETADHLGLSVAGLHQVMAVQAPILTLDAPIEATGGIQRVERLAVDEGPDPEAQLQRLDVTRVVRALLARLPARQAKILRMRFGIGLRDDCTLEQIAQQQGVTRERIRQIEAQALQALRGLEDIGVLREVLSR